MRYVLNHPNMACVIPGFRNECQVACNLGAANRRLSDEDIAFIDQALK
jgi:aryl-alcohol dehydrogenase-like predicted oxidoreductase